MLCGRLTMVSGSKNTKNYSGTHSTKRSSNIKASFVISSLEKPLEYISSQLPPLAGVSSEYSADGKHQKGIKAFIGVSIKNDCGKNKRIQGKE